MLIKPKLYIACPSAEIDRAIKLIESVKRLGYTITYDWTNDVIRYGSITNDRKQAHKSAIADIAGVKDADLVIVLLPSTGSNSYGAALEHGIALACHKEIWTVGIHVDQIWETLSALKLPSDDDVLRALSNYRKLSRD